MKLKSITLALALLVLFAALPAYAADAGNVSLEIGASDLFASMPLCTYWYTKADRRGITPKMTIFNHGFSPITVTSAKLPGSTVVIAGIPCEIMPSMHQDFALTENPASLSVQKRAVRQAVIFTISNGG